MYENKISDKNGVTKYYVGIFKNGPDGKGGGFEDINPVAKDLAEVIKGKNVVGIKVVPDNSEGLKGTNSPGVTAHYDQKGRSVNNGGSLRIYTADPSTDFTKYVLSGFKMSDGKKNSAVDIGAVLAYEIGHVRTMMGLDGFIADFFNFQSSALRLENDARKVRDANSPTCVRH